MCGLLWQTFLFVDLGFNGAFGHSSDPFYKPLVCYFFGYAQLTLAGGYLSA